MSVDEMRDVGVKAKLNVHSIAIHGGTHEDIVVVVVAQNLLDGGGGTRRESVLLLFGDAILLELIKDFLDVF